MNESDAKAALRAMGIIAPSRSLIQNWLRAAHAEHRLAAEQQAEAVAAFPTVNETTPETPSDVATVSTPAPRGKSRLEPVLHEQGTLQEPPRKRNPGRPRIIASWFPAVAATMADGTTLRTALALNGLALSQREMRALYRNRTFKALYQEARRRHLIEHWGRKGPLLRSVLGRCI